MSEHSERPTAQIYQFPTGGRRAAASRWDVVHDERATQAPTATPVLASTGGYHGAAIAEDATDTTWRVS